MAGYLAGDVDEWIYIDIADQHPDSMRFLRDCEKAIRKKITVLKSDRFNSVEEVIKKYKCIKMPHGAPCTGMLKKAVRKKWECEHKEYDLTYVWGMDSNEKSRAKQIVENFPEFHHEFPLIEKYLSKAEVHGLFERTFDFPRPKMYDMGYPNNNCIGCVKGGMGYWNRIRRDFPEVFESRAHLERLVGYSILKESDGTPLYLDELDPNRGDMNTEIFPDCGIMCYLAQK